MGYGGAGQGWGGVGRDGSKISPYPCPTTLAGRGKPARGKAGKGGSSEAAQNCHPQVESLNLSPI